MINTRTTSVCMESYATRGRYILHKKNCVRCNKLVDTRKKYCSNCKVIKHREESKLYQRELRSYIKKSQLAWEKLRR
jgi:arsenate reductase-like glutaredoxin family protein